MAYEKIASVIDGNETLEDRMLIYNSDHKSTCVIRYSPCILTSFILRHFQKDSKAVQDL
jgi:hypothetical protein